MVVLCELCTNAKKYAGSNEGLISKVWAIGSEKYKRKSDVS